MQHKSIAKITVENLDGEFYVTASRTVCERDDFFRFESKVNSEGKLIIFIA